MAKELWQNSRTCGEIAKVCLRSWVVILIVIASGAKQSIFDVAMPSHGLLRGACHRARMRATRWLAMTSMRTSPRLRGEVGDGAKQSLRVRGSIRKCEPVENPLTRSQDARDLSPQAGRGEERR